MMEREGQLGSVTGWVLNRLLSKTEMTGGLVKRVTCSYRQHLPNLKTYRSIVERQLTVERTRLASYEKLLLRYSRQISTLITARQYFSPKRSFSSVQLSGICRYRFPYYYTGIVINTSGASIAITGRTFEGISVYRYRRYNLHPYLLNIAWVWKIGSLGYKETL